MAFVKAIIESESYTGVVVTGGVPMTGARGVHVTGGVTLLGGMKLIGEF